jgi:parallel beta-helix repeat protein
MASPTIRDSSISNNSQYGIECYAYSAPDILNNDITYNGYSNIYLYNHSTALVKDNDILNSKLNFGISVTSSNAIIEHNNILKNEIAGIGCDVGYQVGYCNATINNNTVSQNNGDGMLFQSASPRLFQNTVTYNKGNGVSPSLFCYARLNFNIIQYNEKNGIDSVSVMSSGRPRITNNNISYNNWSGIFVLSGSRPTISNNEIRSNNENGIEIVAASPNINTNNEITYNKHHGIACNFSASPKITDNNIISGNKRNGVYINNSYPEIENNKITKNDWSGIYLKESSDAVIVGNIINNNKKNGISSFTNAKSEIENAMINNNGGFGIISTASSLDLTNSYVNNNGKDGIYLFSNSITVINDTEINSNTGNGIFCKSSSPTIDLCDILNNQANAVYADFYSKPLVINTSIANNNGLDFKVTSNSHPVSLNSTLSKSNVNIDSTSSLTVQWFVNLKVTNSSAGLISDAIAKMENINSVVILNRSTDQNGTINWVIATEYVEFSNTQRTMYTPHDLSIIMEGYQPYDTLITVDQTKWLEIELNHVPSKPANFLPATTHNLTPELQWSPSIEEDMDPVTYHLSLFEGSDNSSTKLIDDAATTSTSYQIEHPLILEYGKYYFVELYADDGKGGISPVLTQIIHVVNNIPQEPSLEIIPVNPRTNDNLICNISKLSKDTDVDPVDTIRYTYRWYKNNILQNEFTVENSTSTYIELPSSETTKHDLWKCEVTPWDGIELGMTGKVQAVILNSAPEIVEPIEDFEFDEDTEDSTTINLYTVFNDADNDFLKFRAERVDQINGFNIKVDIDQTTGKVTLKPNLNWHGEEKILFYAVDYDGAEVFDGVEIKVRSVNDPPILNNTPDQSVYENEWINIQLTAYDNADPKDDLDFSCDALDTYPSLRKGKSYLFDKNTGELSILTDADMIGINTIIVGVTDGNLNGNASQQIQIEVLNRNDPPSALILAPADGKSIGTITSVDLIGQASDPDLEITSANEQLSYVWKSNISGIIGHGLEISDVLLEKGYHKISFIVTDSEGLQGKAEININVFQITGPDDGPDNDNGNVPGIVDNGDESEDKDDSNLILFYALIIVIIVLALILTLFVTKLKKPRKESEEAKVGSGQKIEPPLKEKVETGPPSPEPKPKPDTPDRYQLAEEPEKTKTEPASLPPTTTGSEQPLTANPISSEPTPDMPVATPITTDPTTGNRNSTAAAAKNGSEIKNEGGGSGES